MHHWNYEIWNLKFEIMKYEILPVRLCISNAIAVKQTNKQHWVVVSRKATQEHLTWRLVVELCNNENQNSSADCWLGEYDISAFWNNFSFATTSYFSFS